MSKYKFEFNPYGVELQKPHAYLDDWQKNVESKRMIFIWCSFLWKKASLWKPMGVTSWASGKKKLLYKYIGKDTKICTVGW